MEIINHKTVSSHHSIFPLGDFHFGAADHNSEALAGALSYIKETAKTRTVDVCLIGDIIDAICITDKRFNPAEIAEHYKIRDLGDLPKKQADEVIRVLSPIKQFLAGRWAVVGNHCCTYIKMHYFDVFSYYCEKLGIQKLNKFGIVLKTVTGTKTTSSIRSKIAVTHPANAKGTGGIAPGYEIRSAINIYRSLDIDIGIIGHWHHMSVKPVTTLAVNSEGKLFNKRRWYGVNGCFLNTYVEGSDGYAEGKPGDLADIGMLEIRYDRVGHNGNWETSVIPRFF